MLKLITACCLFATAWPLFAQLQGFDPPNIAQLQKEYPQTDAVQLLKSTDWVIDFKDNQWEITQTTREYTCYLNDNAVRAGSAEVIHFSDFDTLINYQAFTLIPSGKKYKKIPVEKFDTKQNISGSIFYSDNKQLHFNFPALQAGAVTQMQYSKAFTNPYLLDGFYFQWVYPVLNSRVTVTAPQNIKLNYSLNSVNTKHPVKYKTQNLPNNRVLYTWEVQNLPAIKGLEDAPYPSYYIPHLIIYIEQVTTEQGKTTEVLGSTEKLYQWYNSLAASVDTTTSASLRKTVADLLQNLPQNSNNEAKAKTIYEWVQNNIKYVAFEDGLGGFIPRPPNGVYDKKFGDCKDMSILIATMLRLANVPAWLGWVGTRDLPYTYQNMPTPNVDNHMIAVTKLNNEYVFLDGTGEYQPFGKITSMIQGKEVLIGLSPKNFEIVKLPTIAASNNIQHEKITLTIADGRTVTGQAEAVFTGYKKIYTQYNKVKAEYDGNTRFYDDYLKKASNKFEITAISTSGEKPREAPLHINYNFKIPDYTVRAGNNIYLNPHLLKRFGGTQLDSTRTVGRENEYPFEDVLEITIPIPDGYEVDVLPSNSQFEHSQFGYRLTYAQEGKNLVLNHHFWVNYLLLPATEFAQWNKMVNQLETQFSEAIVFKKIK